MRRNQGNISKNAVFIIASVIVGIAMISSVLILKNKKPVETAPLTVKAAEEQKISPDKYDITKIKSPATESQELYLASMKGERPDEEKYLKLRYDRMLKLIANKDLWRDKEKKAFLLTPRERFCHPRNLSRVYDHAFLDIGYGQTISGPHVVGRMTSTLDLKPGEKVLEIGTGSGYQSAVLSYLTDKVYTIEIVEELTSQTKEIYAKGVKEGYPEFGNISAKCDDGYYGWADYAPFDKIIVTCGIDHIPPELIKQLKIGGTMVIPVGPPGAQVLLKVSKTNDAAGNTVITREDMYQGKKKVPFVPFTKKGGGSWSR
ncbi:MAG: protein-L-isoaspartate O-methyltransferase [Candidatus Firestonebacteria bacterium]